MADLGPVGRLLCGAIVGHHGTLPNPGDLDRRLSEAEPIQTPSWLVVAPLAPPSRLTGDGVTEANCAFRAQFLTRMLFSCLTDADDRETSAFYAEHEGGSLEGPVPELCDSHRRAYSDHMSAKGGDGPVNALRAEVLAHVLAQAQKPRGLFTLTVPTGGGKTLASLGFGLEHAAAHGLRRLVYVIPYTSIVEQTASVFRDLLGEQAVLEHHSAFDPLSLDGEDEAEQHRIAAASWDRPVVVTTAVQFFESLFAARKKRCRKLHSLARSVIVLDEAQTMPHAFLRPCLAVLRELSEGYGASVVFCTATQPALTRAAGLDAPEALEAPVELAPDPPALYRRLKRVEAQDLGPQSSAELLARMREAERALLIVDNRAEARRLFDGLREQPGAALLTTLMTPQHRRDVLSDLGLRLGGDEPVRLVATSLIEAGVDIDFPLVLRSMTGIDSLAQAAGRCNREGRLDGFGQLLMFEPEAGVPPLIKDRAAAAREIFETHGHDPLGLDAVAAYFSLLWRKWGSGALDSATVGTTEGIMEAIRKHGPGRTPFEDIETAVRLIEENGRFPVVIRGAGYGVDEAGLAQMRDWRPGRIARALQHHTVDVPRMVWEGLKAAHAVAWWEEVRFGQQFALLEEESLYDAQAGLAVGNFDDLGALLA